MEKREQPPGEAQQVQSVTTKQQQEQEVLDQLLIRAKPDVDRWFRRQFLPIVFLTFLMEAVTIATAYHMWNEWRPTLQLGAVVFTVLGTVVIVLGALPTPRTAAMMSTMRWGMGTIIS